MSKCIFCGKKLISPVGIICPDCAVKNEDRDIRVPDTVVSNLAPESIKADDGKLKWSLMPFEQLEAVSKNLRFLSEQIDLINKILTIYNLEIVIRSLNA